MKQHITIEQLRELNLESRNRLLINADAWNEYKLEHGAFTEHEMCSQISIGKMIEILEQETLYPTIQHSDKWTLEYETHFKETFYFTNTELADCLWEAVKTIL